MIDSPPPSNDGCCDFCFKCESGYNWYDLQGKGRYSNAFRASLARAHCSLYMWSFFLERRGEQNLLGIQNGLVKSFLDQNRPYSFTNTYQSANVFIYRFIHFQIHLCIYSFIKSFVHVLSYLPSVLNCIDAAFWRSSV